MRWVAEEKGFVCFGWKEALNWVCLLWLKQVKFVNHQRSPTVVIVTYRAKELFSLTVQRSQRTVPVSHKYTDSTIIRFWDIYHNSRTCIIDYFISVTIRLISCLCVTNLIEFICGCLVNRFGSDFSWFE